MEQVVQLNITNVSALVDNLNQVKVNLIEGASSSVIELSVDKADLGKVIGKQGRNAMALRLIVSSVAGKIHKRVTLAILD
jgi:predicted RNA-binding protein YlqC (UPF0109 family)